MNQTIIIDKPPLYDEIAAVFRIYGRRDIIFSWGEKIYAPYDPIIAPENLVHEAVHGQQQTNVEAKIRDWWKRYMEDLTFRFDEETVAHRAEYEWLMKHGNRAQRRSALKDVSMRLSGPLYGHVCKPAQARTILRKENGRIQ